MWPPPMRCYLHSVGRHHHHQPGDGGALPLKRSQKDIIAWRSQKQRKQHGMVDSGQRVVAQCFQLINCLASWALWIDAY
jgi:hypothetical protein